MAIVRKTSRFISLMVDRIVFRIISEEFDAEIFTVKKFDLDKFDKFDFVLFDIFHFGVEPFLQRSMNNQNIGFIFYVHTVLVWFRDLILIRPFLNNKDIVIASCGYVEKSLAKLYSNYSPEKFPLFLDREKIQKIMRKRKAPFSLVYMARFQEDKGVLPMLKAIDILRSDFPQIKLFLIAPLSGDKKDGKNIEITPFVESVIEYIDEKKLDKHIILCGSITDQRRFKLISQCNLMLLPTTCWTETDPFCIVESQTCGVPVICSKWAADDELVIDGFNGFLIGVNWDKSKPSVSHVELAEKIRNFFLLPDERKNEMRVNAFNFSKRFSREVVLPRLRKVLIKRSKSRENKTYSWNDIKDRQIKEFPELFSDFIINYSDISSLSFYELYSMNIAAREKSDKFLRDNFVLFYKDT